MLEMTDFIPLLFISGELRNIIGGVLGGLRGPGAQDTGQRASAAGIVCTHAKAVAGSLRAQLPAIRRVSSSRLWLSGKVAANCAAASGSREAQLLMTLSSIFWREASAGNPLANSAA